MGIVKKIGKILFALIFLGVFLFVSGKLFFPTKLVTLINIAQQSLGKKGTVQKEFLLRVGLSEALTSLDPLSNEVQNRERLLNIYEGLVKTDAFLQVEPAIAVAYGAIDDFTWEFRLRKNIFFHDGTKLSVDDVIFSIEQAWKNPRSGVSGFLAALEALQKIDDDRFLIKTKTKDPLLLQKLALVFIFPKHGFERILETPIGTGPYRFLANDNGIFTIEAFQDYWGKKPTIEKAELITLKQRDERKDAFQRATINLLTNVPPEIVAGNDGGAAGLKLMTSPTLESNFLLFGFRGIFQDKNLRKAVTLAIDRNEVTRLAFGFAKPLTQFVGKGVFGFHPNLEIPRQDLEEAKRLVNFTPEVKEKIFRIDLPLGFQAISQFLLERLKRIGLKPEIRLHSGEELERVILEGKSDLFFFGWRSTLGDASGLLGSVMHSRGGEYGSFNGMGYKNPEVDRLIEEADQIFKPLERLEKLRKAMEILVSEDIVGLPLFSPEALYGVSQEIQWTPRIDGFVLASEVRRR